MMKHMHSQSGSALITLIVFSVIGMIVVTGAVAVTLETSRGTSREAIAIEVLSAAEAGADNAILRLLRNPNYSGETLTMGTGTVTITVTGNSTKTITSTALDNGHQRTIQVVGSFANDVFTVSSRQEI